MLNLCYSTMPKWVRDEAQSEDFLTLGHILEHFQSEPSQKKLGVGADCDRADGKRRARLRHLLAPSKGANHLPHGPRRRQHQLVDYCPIALPSIREFHEADPHVHQFSGRFRHLRPRHLRHHAVREASNCDLVRRPSLLHGIFAAGRGWAGNAALAAQFTNHDPPAVGRCQRTSDRHPDPGGGNHEDQEETDADLREAHGWANIVRRSDGEDGARHVPRPGGGEAARTDRQRAGTSAVSLEGQQKPLKSLAVL